MVSFVCNACGNSVKKNQVEKHYQTQCKNCTVLSCIDCGVDFPDDTYSSHTSCITEAEKYQGHLYQAKDKDNKGEVKQKEWMKQVVCATNGVKDPRLRSLLEKISEYSNVPRKQKKFQVHSLVLFYDMELKSFEKYCKNVKNFCKNSVSVYDEKTLNQLWEAFSSPTIKNKENKTNGTKDKEEGALILNEENTADNQNHEQLKKKRKNAGSEEIDEPNIKSKKKKKQDVQVLEKEIDNEEERNLGKFKWHKSIKDVLKEADGELKVKKLRKKVLSAYQSHGTDHRATTLEECYNVFEKKLKTYPKVKISKDTVKFVARI